LICCVSKDLDFIYLYKKRKKKFYLQANDFSSKLAQDLSVLLPEAVTKASRALAVMVYLVSAKIKAA
jgi:hypothetical protein